MAFPLTRLIDGFFAQVVQELGTDETGPSAFKKLLQLPTKHFDDGDQGRAFQQLHSFGVPSSTDFFTFLEDAQRHGRPGGEPFPPFEPDWVTNIHVDCLSFRVRFFFHFQ